MQKQLAFALNQSPAPAGDEAIVVRRHVKVRPSDFRHLKAQAAMQGVPVWRMSVQCINQFVSQLKQGTATITPCSDDSGASSEPAQRVHLFATTQDWDAYVEARDRAGVRNADMVHQMIQATATTSA